MTLEDFIERIERDRPETITAADLTHVHPAPWVNRAGHGYDARIRMTLAGVRYEREQGESIWHRVDSRSDFDVLDAA